MGRNPDFDNGSVVLPRPTSPAHQTKKRFDRRDPSGDTPICLASSLALAGNRPSRRRARSWVMAGRAKSKTGVGAGVGKGLKRYGKGKKKNAVRKTAKTKKKSTVINVIKVADISNGKEKVPITAVNEVDDEPPPAFTYVSKMVYPKSYNLEYIAGCNCDGNCSEDEEEKNCWCVLKNNGELPYNDRKEIMYAKKLVHECGPACNCPSTCRNRVTQLGIKLPLGIFKTEKKGWALRCSTDIPSGTFVCEYVGELLQESEAEARVGHDEYLFDIGRKTGKKKQQVTYTIDAADFANVGRFVNHSCEPNLYAQNVLYDVDDEDLPHVMFFTTEKVPALKELTYNYNYAVGKIRDANGNIKTKKCFCGAAKCKGRLY